MIRFAAVVTDVQEQQRTSGGSRWLVALDPTAFHAGDGGSLTAFSRGGAQLKLTVLEVVTDHAGSPWLVLEKPLSIGTQVEALIAR